MELNGKVIRYGDHINTDVIIPARFLNTSDPAVLAAHCMEDLDATFAGRVCPGDIIVAGKNFGCGSSREHAPIAIKACGVACVIASSFARIFYRNALNIGLPILECPGIEDFAREGDRLSIDFDSGVIFDQDTRQRIKAQPFPPFVQTIIENGGLLNTVREGHFHA